MAEQRATAAEIKEMEERALSVFTSERREDLTALIIAFVLAFIVIIFLK
ncbi:MAG: hypothetical protein HZC12_04205 [Nitrospirae bacterium]|nr:hypothetical protein [Nitrospirota bacterium]